ncbi:hypothetical protein FisN_2Lh590 [Fistulifera solaris]|uniref:Uncharacterized protein n=1 Tax=Fistulifera solaris TaxID=1519565 RepID=A0A1Z5J9S1_FISSO|nr:hypothetical protein FisN_2Lh590 [Fistulifera solaris]|eukprot:GAX10558.1 hypothetical protein FisN_2Lh590 [Fistulifera solaris]
MERIERMRPKRETTVESFVSLADAWNDLDVEDFEFSDNSENSADILEAITLANERIGGRVRFGSVRVQTHKVVLGDNPSCSKGAPMTLAWNPVLSDRFCSVEEFEELRGAPAAPRRVSAKTREGWLRTNGHSRASLIRATNEIVEIKHQRRETAEQQRPSTVERASATPPRRSQRTGSLDESPLEQSTVQRV